MAIFEWAPLMNGSIWKWYWMWDQCSVSLEGAKCSVGPGKCWLESKIEPALQDVRRSFQLDAEIRPPRSLLGGAQMLWTSSSNMYKGPSWQANPTLAFGNKGSCEGREGVGEDDGGAGTTGMYLWNGYRERAWGGKCGARGEGVTAIGPTCRTAPQPLPCPGWPPGSGAESVGLGVKAQDTAGASEPAAPLSPVSFPLTWTSSLSAVSCLKPPKRKFT